MGKIRIELDPDTGTYYAADDEYPDETIVEGCDSPEAVERELKLVQIEDRVYAAQTRWIQKRFGEEAANAANMGWFVDTSDADDPKPWVHISTKIYGHGILHSTGWLHRKRVAHDYQEW